MPNLITNLIQGFMYLHTLKNRLFLLVLCLSAGFGALLGSLTLQETSNGILEKLMCFIVLLYVGFRV